MHNRLEPRIRAFGFLLSIALMLPFVVSISTPTHSQSTQLPVTNPPTNNASIYPMQPRNIRVRATEAEPIVTEVADTLPITAAAPEPQPIQDLTFSITIPRIQLYQVITPDVDPMNKSAYLPIMEQSVAHGAGTALPDEENGNVYLFAHSRDYHGEQTPTGGWFTRIDELREGDEIVIYYHGSEYTYIVAGSEVIDPEDIQVYTKFSQFDGESSLTLQTCYPRGDTSGRLVVYARGE